LHNNSLIVFGGKSDPNLYELDLGTRVAESVIARKGV